VFQVSLPVGLDTAGAVRLGRALAPLRDRRVVILGSGSMTHNLYEFRQSASGGAAYAREFAAWTRTVIEHGELDRLVAYRKLAPHAERAHPTEEHFLPLLVAMGASDAGEPAQLIEGGITHGVLAMDSYAWGLASAPGSQSADTMTATA
jgi:4,5-DOPA dioxygenase extradiol